MMYNIHLNFSKLSKKLENYDVCYTNYRNRKHNFWKKIVSKINNIVSSFLLNKPAKYLSSFRGLKESGFRYKSVQ